MIKHNFLTTCVGWDHGDIDSLLEMIDNEQTITRRSFLRNVDRVEVREIEHDLGYAWHPANGLIMAKDYAVTYHRSLLDGKRCYYFRHSAIEYVFTRRES